MTTSSSAVIQQLNDAVNRMLQHESVLGKSRTWNDPEKRDRASRDHAEARQRLDAVLATVSGLLAATEIHADATSVTEPLDPASIVAYEISSASKPLNHRIVRKTAVAKAYFARCQREGIADARMRPLVYGDGVGEEPVVEAVVDIYTADDKAKALAYLNRVSGFDRLELPEWADVDVLLDDVNNLERGTTRRAREAGKKS